MRINRCIGIAVCLLVAACGQEPADQSADWVLTNGRIYTVDENQPWAEAVVIRDGVFAYVGNNTGAQAFAGDGAKTTDLRGRLVIPGIVDAHTHPGQIDLTRYEESFEAGTREAFMAELEDYARENPGDGWVRGCCWPVQEFVDGKYGPDRRDLDPIFPDRPVWLISTGGHSFWLNGRALDELGLDEDSQDPQFPVAMYKRDETGRLIADRADVERAAHLYEAGGRALLLDAREHLAQHFGHGQARE